MTILFFIVGFWCYHEFQKGGDKKADWEIED